MTDNEKLARFQGKCYHVSDWVRKRNEALDILLERKTRREAVVAAVLELTRKDVA